MYVYIFKLYYILISNIKIIYIPCNFNLMKRNYYLKYKFKFVMLYIFIHKLIMIIRLYSNL